MRHTGTIVHLGRSRLIATLVAFLLSTQAWASSALAVDVPDGPDSVEVTVSDGEVPSTSEDEPTASGPDADEPEEQAGEESLPAQDDTQLEGQPPPDDGTVPAEVATSAEPKQSEVEEEQPALIAPLSDEAPPAEQSDVGIAPLAAGDATIRVRKAGDRLGLDEGDKASGLAGAVFEAYRKGTSTNQNIPSGDPEATCVTDAAGACDLSVNSDSRRYLVVEKSAPSGYSVIEDIALGGAFDSGTKRAYRWNVEVTRGRTTLVPRTEIVNRSSQSWRDRPNPSGPLGRDDYQWANVKDNPVLPTEQCGLDIALLFDLSGSIGSNRGRVVEAGREFVQQLSGTPTSIGVFTFSAIAPKDGYEYPGPQPISDASGTATVDGWIRNLPGASGGTNWDHGLRRIANRGSGVYDLAIVITDGNPTAWRGETHSTSDIDDYDVEAAVHSANWVKNQGSRVIAIGVSGQQGGLNSTNLALISGPNQGDPANPQLDKDYYLTTFGQLADLLSQVALNGCGGTINVSKKIAPTWTGIDSVPLEPNWQFERAPDQTYVSPPAAQTGAQGQPAQFRVTFEQNGLLRDVTITEPDLNSNAPIANPSTGLNARCTITGDSNPDRRVTNVGTNGVTVSDVSDKEIVSCLFVNSPSRLQALKYDDVNGNGRRDSGEGPLRGWTFFLDEDGDSAPDPDEAQATTDANGIATFDRLDAPADYSVCEVLQDGWFNTDPGGGAVCKPARTSVGQTIGPDEAGLSPADDLRFGNIRAGGFTVSKLVAGSGASFIPPGTEYPIEVSCPAPGYPKTLTLASGETETVGPLPVGTQCTVSETDSKGAGSVAILPSPTVTVGTDNVVTVTNTYPAGSGQVTKTVTLGTGLPADLIPAGTEYPVEIRCTYPTTAGYPRAGEPIPGFDPLRTTVESGAPGQAGPPAPFGPLPAGSQCTVTETNSNGATEVDIQPEQPVTIPDGTTPVSVTVTNAYEPAVVKIVKVVEGATLPADTTFQAQVTCTDGTSETVDFSVATPGFVSNIVQGSTCEVTETQANGGVPSYSPEGPFPVGGPSVEVTITNTFASGSLTVTKGIDDNGSGVVPDGTSFTVDVACTYDGSPVTGFPTSLTLTKPGSLSQTLTDIPVGARCTVTETDDAGADVTTISPTQPVTITPAAQGPVEVTVTNVFRTAEFRVTKVVDDPAGLVPADTEYTVELRCTYPDSYQSSGPIPGFNPRTLMLTAGQTASSGALPVGAECTIAETDAGGARSVDVTPDSLTVGNGSTPATVTVTNTYPVGNLDLRKAVDDGGSGTIPDGTEYTLRVQCEFPADHPAQGPIPGFSPVEVTVESGIQGRPGPVETVTGIPVGASCTVSEPDRRGAASVDFVPPQPVTITEDVDDPVEVVATNTYPVGSGQVVKIADGSLAPEYAPQGSSFLAGVTCTYPAGFPDSGPIPGYNPSIVTIDSGQPGQEGTPAPFGPVPIGSQCTVVELDDGGATDVTISPAQPITIQDAQTPAKVTITNTFEAAGLQITKIVDGPGAALVPPDIVYTARVICAFDGPDGVVPVFNDVVDFGVGSPAEVPGPGALTGIPVGSVCEVREVETNGASARVVPNGPFVVDGDDPVSVDVTVTNTFPAGQLTLTKVVDDPLGLVPDGTTYAVSVQCELAGSRLVDFPREVPLTTPNQLSRTLTGLPVGSVCFASETDTNGAVSPPVLDPPGTEDFQSGKVTVLEQPPAPLEIQVTNTYPSATGQVVKVVDGPQAGVAPEGTEFEVQVSCDLPADHPAAPGVVPGYPTTLTVEAGPAGQAGTPVAFGPVPLGSECTVTETDDKGATSVAVAPAQPVTLDDGQTPVEITVTNTFSDGGLTVTKVVDGPAASLVPADTQYSARVACTFGSQTIYDQELPFGVGSPATVTDLPVGSQCTVTETDAQGAGTVTVTPSDPVTITGGDSPVEVSVTNTYPAGSVQLTKTVDGPLASLAPEGTQFTVAVACDLPAGFPGGPGTVPGYPTAVTIEAGAEGVPGAPVDVGPLPVGASCQVSELDSKGSSQTVIEPSSFTVESPGQRVDVSVTNTYQPAALRILKVVDGPGAALIPAKTTFTAEVTCVPPVGSDAPGFAGEVTFGVDDPGVVSGQPVGSECTVLETDSQGAQDVSYEPASQTVTLTDAETPVQVTVTNTFGAGELTVTKALAGAGSGFVPDGTSFTVEVRCEFATNPIAGFNPWTVDLTPASPTASSSVVGALPVGAECAVTETQDQGAASVDITPTQPVTVGSGDPVEVTVTNTFGTGMLTVRKNLQGPGAAFLPDGTEFVVQVRCSYLGDDVAGFAPATVTLTTPDALSQTLGPLPVGAECAVTETQSQGAAVSYDPRRPVTVGSGDPVEVTVTNTFQAGLIRVEKLLAGSAAQLLPDGTVFSTEVVCEFAGAPVPGYDPKIVELTTPDRLSMTMGSLPVGAECTVTETDAHGAQNVSYVPEPPTVTVANGPSPVEVSVTNTFLAGSGRVVKVVDGPLASLAPEGTQFTVAVDCQLPAGFPGAPGPVPGYPTSLTIEAGPAGAPGAPVPFGPLPLGSTCSVSESDANGADPVDVSPSSFTIERPGQTVDVTVTNTYRPAALQVLKVVDGPGAALIPPDTVFTAEVVCVPPGVGPGFSGEVTFGVNDPGIVSGQVAGSECTVTETNSQGAANVSYSPSATVTLDPDPNDPDAPVQVDVTVTNTFQAGELTVEKVLDGAGAGFVPDGTTFSAEVECTFAGNAVAGFDPWTVDLTTPNDLTASSSVVGDLPVGAECAVTETQDQGAANVDIAPPQPVTVTPAGQGPVEVTLTNTFTTGELTVSKVLDGPGASLVPDGTVFAAEVSCEYLGSPVAGFAPATVTLTTPDGLTDTLGPLPTGAQCTVVETQDQGAANVDVSPSQPVTVTDGETPVEVTITNTINVGTVLVEKAVSGSGATFLPDGTVFTVEVACTFGGSPVPGFDPFVQDLTTPDQLVQTVGPVPIGSECAVVETEDQGAQAVVVDPSSVTVGTEDAPARVRVTNTFRTGELTVTKVIDGAGATFVPDGTVFGAEVSCEYLGQPVNGFSPFTIDLTTPDELTRTVGPLPIGAVCTVTETDDNGAQSVQLVQPDPVQSREEGPVEATITNTFETDEFTVTKVVDGDGATFVPDGTVYEVEASCEYLGAPVAGFDPLLVQLTTPGGLTQAVGPLPVGAECALSETQSRGAAMVSVIPSTIEVGALEGPAEVTVTNTYATGGLTIEKVIEGSANLVEGSFQFDVACTFLGSDLDPQPGTATITPPETSVDVDGIPVGAECTVVELAPYGGADGPAVVEPGSVVVSSGDRVVVTATNTFTAPPKPPKPPTQPPVTPPTMPPTGADGLGPILATAATLVLSGAALVTWALWHRRRVTA